MAWCVQIARPIEFNDKRNQAIKVKVYLVCLSCIFFRFFCCIYSANFLYFFVVIDDIQLSIGRWKISTRSLATIQCTCACVLTFIHTNNVKLRTINLNAYKKNKNPCCFRTHKQDVHVPWRTTQMKNVARHITKNGKNRLLLLVLCMYSNENDFCSRSLFFSLFLYRSLSLSLCRSLFLSLSLPFRLFVSRSISYSTRHFIPQWTWIWNLTDIPCCGKTMEGNNR